MSVEKYVNNPTLHPSLCTCPLLCDFAIPHTKEAEARGCSLCSNVFGHSKQCPKNRREQGMDGHRLCQPPMEEFDQLSRYLQIAEHLVPTHTSHLDESHHLFTLSPPFLLLNSVDAYYFMVATAFHSFSHHLSKSL